MLDGGCDPSQLAAHCPSSDSLARGGPHASHLGWKFLDIPATFGSDPAATSQLAAPDPASLGLNLQGIFSRRSSLSPLAPPTLLTSIDLALFCNWGYLGAPYMTALPWHYLLCPGTPLNGCAHRHTRTHTHTPYLLCLRAWGSHPFPAASGDLMHCDLQPRRTNSINRTENPALGRPPLAAAMPGLKVPETPRKSMPETQGLPSCPDLPVWFQTGHCREFPKEKSCCPSTVQSCSSLCDLTDCSVLGFPVLHLQEFAQTHHVH